MRILQKTVWFAMPVFLAACSSAPELKHSTRTGKIYDIKIGDQLMPQKLSVHPGDEVRWVNSRSAPIKIVFVDVIKDRVSCEHGFITGGAVTGMFSEDATKARITTVQPDDFASLCFATPGMYVYNARMESPTPGGEKNLEGVVQVGQ